MLIRILIVILIAIIRLIFLIGNVQLSPYLILIITLRLGVNFSHTYTSGRFTGYM